MDLLVDFLLNFYGPTPYLLIFGILLLCGFGLPIPEDITLFAGGLLAYYGVVDLSVMTFVAFLGVMVGDSVSDVKAARAAGFAIVCMSYGYNHGIDIRTAQPDAVIDSLVQLQGLLEAAA